MSSSLTYKGEEYCLKQTGGSLAVKAAFLRLYRSESTLDKTGSGFIEVTNGNGYTAGGIAISSSDWAYSSGPSQIVLANKVWTATGQISNVAGAYIVDASGNVLAWWERAGGTVTLQADDTITTTSLTVRMP